MFGRLVTLITAAILVVLPATASAQSEVSLGLGLGTIRFPGGSTVGVLSLAPALRLVSPGRSLEAGGAFAKLPSSPAYAQARAGAWAATSPLAGHWRLAVEAQLSGATAGRGAASGAGQLGLEALFTARRWGAGVAAGPASGWIVGAAPVTAWRARLRGWWEEQPNGREVFAGIEPTRFLGAWFTDLTGGVTLRDRRLEVRFSGAARVSRAFGSKAAALVAAEFRLAPGVSLEGSGGNVLPDPYQGLPASGFVTVGIRAHWPFHAAPRTLLRSRTLAVFRQGAGIVIRLRLRDAQVVTIAGDWNEWAPAPLVRTGPDQWDLTVTLTPGPHRFLVFIDGAPWLIPDGVPSVPDGMGGRVAVLNVF